MAQSAEAWYYEIASALSDDQINSITRYYQNWKGQNIIELKFRFLKGFFYNKRTQAGEWHLIHQVANKRRISSTGLPQTINSLITEGYIPIRIFHSVSEWLSPNEVFTNYHHQAWLIRSGFVPLEDDRSLEDSLVTAREVYKQLGEGHIIYSGNKSIHIWYPIQLSTEFSLDEETTFSSYRILNADRKLRKKVFRPLQKKYPHLDKRIAMDPWRVVPVISSLNATTGRIVTRIDKEKFATLDAGSLRERTIYKGWCE